MNQEMTIARFTFQAAPVLAALNANNGTVERRFKLRRGGDIVTLHWTYGRKPLAATGASNSEAVCYPFDLVAPENNETSDAVKFLVVEVARFGARRPHFANRCWFE